MKSAYYAIKSKKGCWGSQTRYQDCLIARVEGANSKQEALEKFRSTTPGRGQYEKEYEAIAPSRLTQAEKEWIENYVEEIIKV